MAVPPPSTRQNCYHCGQKVSKSLLTRTDVCPHCGYVEDCGVGVPRSRSNPRETTMRSRSPRFYP